MAEAVVLEEKKQHYRVERCFLKQRSAREMVKNLLAAHRDAQPK